MATKNAKRGLGKGLDSLIPAKTSSSKEQKIEEKHIEGNIVNLRITEIVPNKTQPRRNFDEESIEELAISIKEYGGIQPIIVTKKDNYYQIVAGERRWRASWQSCPPIP